MIYLPKNLDEFCPGVHNKPSREMFGKIDYRYHCDRVINSKSNVSGVWKLFVKYFCICHLEREMQTRMTHDHSHWMLIIDIYIYICIILLGGITLNLGFSHPL